MNSYMPLGEKRLVKVSVPTVAAVTLFFPLTSFVICVLLSVYKDFDEATSTHCRVPNYLPSISAAIGGFTPQRYIWRIGIALHAAPRFLAAFCYYSQYLSRLGSLHRSLIVTIRIAFFLNATENLALIGLTYVSSTENYPVHEKFFVTFMLCSEIYMLISCYLAQKFRSPVSLSLEEKSIRWKYILAFLNIAAFLFALYFFWRHNAYCEPLVYTKFALCEYIVVLSNMGFHMTAYWDFANKELIIGSITDKLS